MRYFWPVISLGVSSACIQVNPDRISIYLRVEYFSSSVEASIVLGELTLGDVVEHFSSSVEAIQNSFLIAYDTVVVDFVNSSTSDSGR